MNIVDIGEPIRVMAAFSGGGVEPLRFFWEGRSCEVEEINGRWIDREQNIPNLHFSVQSGMETFYLHFCTADVQWWLDRVIVE